MLKVINNVANIMSVILSWNVINSLKPC